MKISIAFLGMGGQGIVFAAEVLAEALFEKGYYVSQMQSYGAEVRGGSVLAYVIASTNRIVNPFIEGFDLVLLIHNLGLHRWLRHVTKSKIIIYDLNLAKDVETIAVKPQSVKVGVDLVSKLSNVGLYRVENVGALGIVVGLNIVPELRRDDVVEVLKKRRDFEKNVKALDIGIEIGKELRSKLNLNLNI